MTTAARFEDLLARFPAAAAVLYGTLVVAFLVTAGVTVLDLAARHDTVVAAAEILDRMDARGPTRPRPATRTDVAVPEGSPFLEGPTASVAGAGLLQRLAHATARVRGNILSSQVDLQGSPAKAGFITATASLEVEPASLQPLLYDLEAGMPFLFVEQMVVQAPTGAANATAGKVRVLLSVSGQWQGAK